MIERVDLLQVSNLDFQISLGSLYRLVSKKLGDIGDVHTVGDEIGGNRMAIMPNAA